MAAVLPKRLEWPAPWLKGEVKLHCIRCEAEVGRLERTCPKCSAVLRKECPVCHYWVEMDTATCISCRHSFPLPLGKKTTIRMWHSEDRNEHEQKL